jgi:23S rRNA (uracil1939-C5)-methyltransferase
MRGLQRVLDALLRIGKLNVKEVYACIASPLPLAYRNKIQAPIRIGEAGHIRIGFNEKSSHNLVDVDFCYIHCAIGQAVYEVVVDVLKNTTLSAYDFQTNKGFLRYLIIKSAVKTNQVLVVLVTNKGDAKELKIAAQEIIKRSSHVKGVVQNINPLANNVVLGDTYHLLAGQDYIEENILGLKFKVSPASFFQVNPEQAENLYKTVMEYADLQGDEIVLDAYCGVGTISLLLSKYASQVIGVECVSQAVEDAKENAKKNKIENATFICDHAENYIQSAKNIDIAILNPPRKGCEESLINSFEKSKVKKIIYVSCDPATLARDVAILQTFDYEIIKIQPFDMFPQTAHVETVVLLINKHML